MKVNYTHFNWRTVLAIIWQLPQTVIAVLIMLICFDRDMLVAGNNDIVVHEVRMNLPKWLKFNFCFSLGIMIFTPYRVHPKTVQHEVGHSIQSLYLGPLYFLVVAIPSMILIIVKKMLGKNEAWYRSKYPECWADKLAGISYE